MRKVKDCLPWTMALLTVQVLCSYMLYTRVEAVVFDSYLGIIVPISSIAHGILIYTYHIRSDRFVSICCLSLFHMGLVLQTTLVKAETLEKALAGVEGVENPMTELLTNNLVVISGAVLGVTAFRYLLKHLEPQLLRRFLVVATAALFISLLLFGTSIHGVKAWIVIGGFQFQPTELIKLSTLIYIALVYADEFLSKKQKYMRTAVMLGATVLGFLIINELGSFLVIGLVFMILTFLACDTTDFLVLAGGISILGLVGCLVVFKLNMAYVAGTNNALTHLGFEIFQKVYNRIQLTYHLELFDPYGIAYQAVKARDAVRMGGLWGNELNVHIPVAESEYITVFASLKYGLVTVLMITIFYMGVLIRGNRIAERNKDMELRNLAIVASYLIGLQSLMTIFASFGLVPLTGMTINFLSKGFTSQLTNFFCFFLLLQTGSKAKEHKKGGLLWKIRDFM